MGAAAAFVWAALCSGARIQPSGGEGETQTTDATAGLRLWGIWDTWTGPPGLQEVLGEKTFMENNSSIGQRVLIVKKKKYVAKFHMVYYLFFTTAKLDGVAAVITNCLFMVPPPLRNPPFCQPLS